MTPHVPRSGPATPRGSRPAIAPAGGLCRRPGNTLLEVLLATMLLAFLAVGAAHGIRNLDATTGTSRLRSAAGRIGWEHIQLLIASGHDVDYVQGAVTRVNESGATDNSAAGVYRIQPTADAICVGGPDLQDNPYADNSGYAWATRVGGSCPNGQRPIRVHQIYVGFSDRRSSADAGFAYPTLVNGMGNDNVMPYLQP